MFDRLSVQSQGLTAADAGAVSGGGGGGTQFDMGVVNGTLVDGESGGNGGSGS